MAIKKARKEVPFDGPGRYRICVQGYLDHSWSDRLGGMQIQAPDPEAPQQVTTLTGELIDQAALSGVLNTIYDMHMTLLSVNYLNGD
jgi:hypothetical protein